MDVGRLLACAAERFDDRPAVTVLEQDGEDNQCTYRELEDASRQLANGLLEKEIGFGDPVAILADTSLRFIQLYFAAQKIGAIPAPMNTRASTAEIEELLDLIDPAALIVDGGQLAERNGLRPDGIRNVAIDDRSDSIPSGWRSIEELTDHSRDPPGIEVGPDAVDGYFFTSGSSGTPKGVVHTHRDRVIGSLNVSAAFGIRYDDVHLMALPLFHAGPLFTGLLPFLTAGAHTVLQRSFDPRGVLEAISIFEATVVGGVPAQYGKLLDVEDHEKHDCSSVRFCWFSGAPMTDHRRERCQETFSTDLVNVYGSTEAGPPISIGIPGAGRDIGYGFALHRYRIVDPNQGDPTAECPTGEPGELIVTGPSVMERYLDRPQLTAQRIVGEWLFTGDLAWRDEDGAIHIEGRKDETIISGGENIAPAEIEEILDRHPNVSDVAVIGMANDEWGEVPKAFVVTTDNPLTEQEVIDFVQESELASFKRPREVAFVDEIPRNPSGGSVRVEELRALDED